ncbi:MFS transporter [Actinokineospora cianjurensis]|uniref:MFS transporter n=1 Tax=Actinokineospora cianjurensis TaxID=585224 RepID=UPI001477015B|nr:MFS transporter [Actinokineospora cianjurensis]
MSAPASRRAPLPSSVYVLALATLAVGTSGHAVAGLLPWMSADLSLDLATLGQLVTLFAITCALAGPVLAVATGRWERRTLLVTSLLVAALGNAAAALASGFGVLAAARVLTALGAASATAVAVGMAAQSTPAPRRATAMAVTLTGVAAAVLVGVPSAAAAARVIGYHAVLASVATLCAVAATAVAVAAPPVPAPPVLSLRERVAAAGQRRVLAVLGGGLLSWTATFIVYPYLAALVDRRPGGGAPLVVLLAAYGVGAVLGNAVAGRAADRFGPRAPLVATTAVTAVMLLWVIPATVDASVGGPVAMLVWGMAGWSANPALNAWLAQLDEDRSAVLFAVAGSAIYLGMGLGTLVGGGVLVWAGADLLGPVAAGFTLAACLLLAVTGPPARPWREDLLPSQQLLVPEGALLRWRLR